MVVQTSLSLKITEAGTNKSDEDKAADGEPDRGDGRRTRPSQVRARRRSQILPKGMPTINRF